MEVTSLGKCTLEGLYLIPCALSHFFPASRLMIVIGLANNTVQTVPNIKHALLLAYCFGVFLACALGHLWELAENSHVLPRSSGSL